jgi:prepilin-type N-terminal cleavage/methylation domain-containing protein
MTCKSNGFTLIEIILTMSLIAITSMISAPILIDSSRRNDLDISINTAVVAARRANLLARSSEGGRSWGVHFEGPQLTIFKCPSVGDCTYQGRLASDTDFDEQFVISSAISISGTVDYVFEKITGYTTGGSTNFINNNDTKSVSINPNGLVNY